MKDTICVAVGLVGGFFTAIFGGWDSALVTLVVFMAIDFFTGIITAIMKKSKHTESGGLSSKAGWFGLAKKVCTLMLIVVAVRMDILLNTNYIRDAVCISFCLNELLSIVENTSLWVTPHSVGRCRGATEGPGPEGLAASADWGIPTSLAWLPVPGQPPANCKGAGGRPLLPLSCTTIHGSP